MCFFIGLFSGTIRSGSYTTQPWSRDCRSYKCWDWEVAARDTAISRSQVKKSWIMPKLLLPTTMREGVSQGAEPGQLSNPFLIDAEGKLVPISKSRACAVRELPGADQLDIGEVSYKLTTRSEPVRSKKACAWSIDPCGASWPKSQLTSQLNALTDLSLEKQM